MFNSFVLLNLISTLIGSVSFTKSTNYNLKDGSNSINIKENDGSNFSQNNNEYVYLDFKTSYFDGLREKYNRNVYDSCGYVAMSMLLYYYDTYLSDYIVPEKYENKSKGSEYDMTLRKKSPGGYIDYLIAKNYIEYYGVITNLSTPSLQGKLMEIAYQNNIIDFISATENKESPFLTSFDDRKVILNKYFKEINGYEYGNEYTFSYEYTDNSSVKEFTINEIKKGNPVLLSGIMKGEGVGHAVIAYEYSDGIIYCHSGYDQSTFSNFYHVDVDNCFETFRSALVINFNIPHICSNSYIVDNQSYCYHDCLIHTYNGSEKHIYDSSYQPYNSSKHKAICKCGNFTLRGHAVDSTKIFVNKNHKYANCLDCKYLVDLGITSAITPSNNLFITKNGSYMLDNGVYVIVKEDLESYLNKALPIFNKEEG